MAKKSKSSDYASLEEFKKAVLITKDLISKKIVKVVVLSDELVDIRLDKQKFEKEKIKEIDKEQLTSLLNREIPILITASLQKKPHMVLEAFLIEGEYDKDVKDMFDKKLALIKQELITPELKQRTLLKEISKNDILDELTWDISNKVHDLEKGPIDNLQFTTIKLVLNKGLFHNPFTSLAKNREQKSVTIDLHLDDLEQLIDELSVLRDNLKK